MAVATTVMAVATTVMAVATTVMADNGLGKYFESPLQRNST